MACYEAWNSAIANYFISGAPKGSHIFLSLDDEAVEDITAKFLDEEVDGEPLDDFITAVRERCVLPSHEGLDLSLFQGYFADFPRGVGFLGVMVVAAYRMQDEEGVDESNYFLRFREVLQLPSVQGRPDGMPAGAEEPLWIAWNHFLVHSGFQSSAERGAGPQTYLRYVFSQAILRESDKQFLRQRYRDQNLDLQFDVDQLGFWLSRQQITRKHLSEGLHHPDPARVWEFYRAAHRVYDTGDWLDNIMQPPPKRPRTRSIEGGIYRSETLLGDAHYFLFPKQPERSRSCQLFILRKDVDEAEPLRPLRAGFFKPMWEQEPFVDEPLHLALSGDPYIQKLIFPRRDFWILTSDPESSYGVFATWKPYLELGEKLLVLCRRGPFVAEMSRLKEAALVDWSRKVECNGWVEYLGCMVLSYDWGGFISTPECRALANALAPRTAAGVALSGGLRDPNQNAWLAGFPPSLKVFGFEKQFEVIVTTARGVEVFRDEVPRQQELCLSDDLEPDVYAVEVTWSGKPLVVRMFRIIPWDSLQEHPDPEDVVNSNPVSTAGLCLRGPFIMDDVVDAGAVPHA